MLGFWFHADAPDHWPLPQHLVGRWRAADRAVVSGHLRAGRRIERYERASHCRFGCGARAMGRDDVSDGVFVWPAGLAHYVERHAVRLPPRFVAHALRGVRVDALPSVAVGFGSYDAGPWLRWARAQGACLDLRGWARPDAKLQRRLRADAGRHAPGTPVLCRRTTRDVVLLQRDGSVVVWSLRTRAAVRRLAGWHEWPVMGGARK